MRAEERVKVELPVRLEHATGLTCDLSASGVKFLMNSKKLPEREICFDIEINAFNEKLRVRCRGSIVRTQEQGEQTSVAVEMTESIMETLNQP